MNREDSKGNGVPTEEDPGYISIDPNRYGNILYAPSAENNQSFKNDINTLIDYYDKNGLTVLDELNEAAGAANMPIFLTNINPLTGSLDNSMRHVLYQTHILLSINTRSGLSLGRKGVQSPALGILHEAHHAINFLKKSFEKL